MKKLDFETIKSVILAKTIGYNLRTPQKRWSVVAMENILNVLAIANRYDTRYFNLTDEYYGYDDLWFGSCNGKCHITLNSDMCEIALYSVGQKEVISGTNEGQASWVQTIGEDETPFIAIAAMRDERIVSHNGNEFRNKSNGRYK